MSNTVDTSTDTVNAEFDAAAEALGVDQPDASTEDQNPQTALDEAQQQAELAMTTDMIATSLRFSIGGLVNVAIPEQAYQDTAQAYAVLIIKYFPGGIFALLERYKEEIGAATATFVLIKVVRDAKREQREKEAEKNRPSRPMATRNPPENQPEASQHG